MASSSRHPWELWSSSAWEWKERLARSPVGVSLHDWLYQPEKYFWLDGQESYRRRVVALLDDAEYEDCAAAGFRFDVDNLLDGDKWVNDWLLRISWTECRKHRAVIWKLNEYSSAELWVDGRQVRALGHARDETLPIDSIGVWLAQRYFVISVAGPQFHPAQRYGMGVSVLGEIQSLLIFDAETRQSRVESPKDEQAWVAPFVQWDDGRILIYSGPCDSANICLDRVLQVEELFR